MDLGHRCITILAVASGLYVRRFAYEFFLISHIISSVFVIVGRWYHIYYRTGVSIAWGYQTWIEVACIVWFFDRAARVARILKTGMRCSKVTDIGGGYFRVDVPGIRWDPEPGKHVYTYFPMLNPLRPWENHPFSVVPSALLRPYLHSPRSDKVEPVAASGDNDVEKSGKPTSQVKGAHDVHSNVGLTLFINQEKGMTKSLRADDNLLTLLDGGYYLSEVASESPVSYLGLQVIGTLSSPGASGRRPSA